MAIAPTESDIGRRVFMLAEIDGVPTVPVYGHLVSVSDDLVQMRLEHPAIPDVDVVWTATEYLEWAPRAHLKDG